MYDSYLLRYSDLDTHPAKKLWDVAEKCESLSGRSLHRLPALALVLHTTSDPCSINEMMEALRIAVEDEVKTNEELENESLQE